MESRKRMTEPQEPSGLLEIGDWLVDPATRRISRGETARRVSPKAAQVLSMLAEAAGGVVSRKELLDRAWPEVTVGEEVLTQAIAELRRAFQDSARAPLFIETVHKAGYRLLAPVRRAGAAEQEPAIEKPAPPPREPEQEAEDQTAIFVLGREHKQVTVLDCALSNAAALAGQMDAETMADTVDSLHQIARTVIDRYEGTVAQWQGDGLVALFGAPRALEDHPRRAVSAAIELMRRFEADSALGDKAVTDRHLSIGIHTGPAVVGLRETGSREIFTAIGVTTETAKQLRLAAAPGVLLASQVTYDSIGSEVAASPVELDHAGHWAFQVQRFTDRRSGVPRRAQPFLSGFVGRRQELDMLLARIDSLPLSGGQVINVVGDPGIGKSRLTAELETRLAPTPVQFLRANCLPHGRRSPYLPLTHLLRELCLAGRGTEEETLADLLIERLQDAGLDTPEPRALLRQRLGLGCEPEVLEPLTSEQQRRQTFDYLHRLIAVTAEKAPLVLLIEDLHWIDATSEAWLEEQAMRLTGRPVLLLVTHRPGYRVPWQSQSSSTQIALPILDPESSRALIRSVPRDSELPDIALESVISRAQGNPFFLEELAFTYPSDDRPVTSIPDTVQAVIGARIDHLPAADKRLLQIAAVVGARIPLELLARIDRLEETQRHDSLQRLQQAELLYERRGAPDHIFAFKHALTQEVAYLGLLAKTRRSLHQEIADALSAHFPALTEDRPEILARHLTEAGERRAAIDHWYAAGRKAAAQANVIEAAAHYETALTLIEREKPSGELSKTKLAILIDLGVVQQALKGAGAPEVGEVYRKACALSREIAEARKGFVATWGLWRYEVLNAAFAEADDLAEELLAFAREDSDEELDLQARHAIWTTARFTGSLAQAIEHSEAGLALAHPRYHSAPHYAYGGHDPICCARGTRAIVLGLQGFADTAGREMDATIALAKEIGHRPTTAGVYLNAADLYLSSRNREALAEAARELRMLGDELGFTMHINIARFSLAWCRFKAGEEEEGLAEMRRVLARARQAGGNAREPYHYALFADCLAETGQYDKARHVIEEAFEEISEKRQHHWAKSEAHRMLGEILLNTAGGQTEVAEGHFGEALKIARHQGALSLELRAACSMSQLRRRQGRAAEGLADLQSVYDRFAEGFGSADLSYARGLLTEGA